MVPIWVHQTQAMAPMTQPSGDDLDDEDGDLLPGAASEQPRSGPIPVAVGDDAAGQRLDRVLAAAVPAVSRSRLQALIKDGQVQVGGAVCERPRLKLRGGEAILVTVPPPLAAEPAGEDIPLTVVFEDAHLIVINKPAGWWCIRRRDTLTVRS